MSARRSFVRKQWNNRKKRARRRILALYFYRCPLCGTIEDLTIDHVIPIGGEMGGTNEDDNLQVLCLSCHRAYGGLEVKYEPWPACAGMRELIEKLEVLRCSVGLECRKSW
ncbi:MAG: HNH endonuclease [Rhodocyclaceae bacterium]|nr:HNH endonuclease [Rhodocyclaceae bacterium]MBK6906277.1 HNH endonuclease [Rhodocyclaceae bacterium]